MRRRHASSNHDTSGEFELDLAPLLAVMVKLVPVLLVSSAFVQLMIVETELPQAVQQAVQQDLKTPTAHVSLDVDSKTGVKIVVVNAAGKGEETVVPMKDGAFDYASLHAKLVEVKKANPTVFKLDLRPAAGVEYGDLVHIMDEARKARDAQVMFPVKDQTTGQDMQTPYMFPEVVFANSLEG